MNNLFNKRAIEVTIGTKLITGLKMEFKVLKTLDKKPNTAEVKIYNLSSATRATFQKPKLPALIMAGYDNYISQVFSGYLREPSTQQTGTDIITTFTAGDGEVPTREARINKSFAKGITLDKVIKELGSSLEAAGIHIGEVLGKLNGSKINEAVSQFVNGCVLNGNTWEVFTNMLSRTGYEASIQDGNLQILELGKANDAKSVLLERSTGLIGSPEKGKKGIIKARSLLQPSIYPGRAVQIKAHYDMVAEKYGIEGFYRCIKVSHIGDTHGNDWYTDIEGNPL